MVGVRVPIVPMSHQYVVTQPFRDVDAGACPAADAARPRPARLLPRGRRRAGDGRLRAAVRSRSRSGRTASTRSLPDFNGRLLPEEWERLEEIYARTPWCASRRWRTSSCGTVVNGPEGFTPDNEFCLGPDRRPRLLGGCRLLRPRDRRRRRHGQGRWPTGCSTATRAWTCGRWTSAGSARTTARRRTRSRASSRTTRPTTTSGTPARSGWRVGRCATSPAYPWHREHGAVLRREGRLGAGQLLRRRTSPSATTRAEPLRVGRAAVVARRSRRSTGRPASPSGSSTRPRSPRSRSPVAGAADLLEHLCDNRVARGAGRITYTQMLNARGGVECDFTVTQVEDQLFQIVTGTAFGVHDLSWIRRNAPRDGSVLVRDVTSAWTCFAVWGPQAREVLAPLTPQSLDDRRLPLHDDAADHRRRCPGPTAARDLRRRARLGGLRPDRARRRRCGPLLADRCGGGRRAALRLQGHRLPAGREGLSLLGERRHRRRDAVPGRARLLRPHGQGRTSEATPSTREPARRLACLTLADPLRAVLGNEPVRVAGRTVGRVTSGAIGHTVGAVDRLRLPPDGVPPRPAPRVQVLVFGDWVDATVAVEPLYDPTGARVRA